jgi:hypothetical protein
MRWRVKSLDRKARLFLVAIRTWRWKTYAAPWRSSRTLTSPPARRTRVCRTSLGNFLAGDTPSFLEFSTLNETFPSPDRATGIRAYFCFRGTARLRTLHQQALAETELEVELRGEDIQFKSEANSLQSQLVTYLRKNLGFSDLQDRLIRTRKAQLQVLQKVRREALLGLHPANKKELEPLVEGFSNYERFLLNKVVFSGNSSERLKEPEMIELFTRKFRAGLGSNLLNYLAARLRHQQRRAEGKREIFNPELLILGMLSTDPHLPLWLMPSAGATNIINRILDEPGRPKMSCEAYRKLAREHGLDRLKRSEMDKFIADSASEPRGRKLRQWLE